MTKEIALKFLKKLKININDQGCHIPIKYVNRVNPYTRVGIDKKEYTLHRLVLVAYHNIDYDDKSVESRHLCRNKRCINQVHVVPGTVSDNTLDQVDAGVHRNAIKDKCPKCGGPYTLKLSRNARYCRNCETIREQQRRERNRNETRTT